LQPRFDDVDFHGPVDFSGSTFCEGAYFVDVRNRAEAVFQGASFRGEGLGHRPQLCDTREDTLSTRADLRGPSASLFIFEYVTADRGLNFTSALFPRAARFTSVDCGGAISLADADFYSSLETNHLASAGLAIDFSRLDRLSRHTRVELLRLVEKGAKARGDYGLANKAFYRLQTLRRHDYPLPLRAADWLFYQQVAGYFVRPENPLRILFALAALTAAARVVRRQRQHQSVQEVRQRFLSLPRFGWQVVEETGATLKDAVPKRFGGTGAARIHGPELLAYRILIVCTLITLWANPTLRQYIQFIR
jgi:hypothetical protein